MSSIFVPIFPLVAITVSVLSGFSCATNAGTWTVDRLAYDLDTAEGPVWHPEGKLYFAEIFAERVYEYTPATSEFNVIRRDSGGTNGMAFDLEGRLLMCEMLERRVTRLEKSGTVTILWEAEDSGKGGPNDIVVSSSGNLYFTMPRHRSVYRISPDGEVFPLLTDLPGINGVMLSRDETSLYVTEYKARRVHVFPLDEAKGTVGPGRIFAEIETDGTEHGADGMAADSRDRLYVACLGGVWIFAPDGKQVGFIPLEEERATNCAFGKSDSELFITTQQGLFRAVFSEED